MTRLSPAFLILVLVTFGCNCSSSGSSPTSRTQTTSTPQQPPSETEPLDARESILASAVGSLLSTEHLRAKPLDDSISRTAFDGYLKAIDPTKTFLLKSDVETLRAHADRIDDEMKSGQLELARASTAILNQRLTTVEKLVAAQLAKPFDFTADESVETDIEELEFVATEAELTDRWRKNLKLEALERISRMEEVLEARKKGAANPTDPGAAEADPEADDDQDGDAGPVIRAEDVPDTFAGREKKAREDLAKTYSARFARLAKLESVERLALYLNAVANAYDPHTAYLPPASKENFDIQMSGQLEGIGAVLAEQDHYIRVMQIVPGGASWRQGDLEAGDLIMAVAQQHAEPVDVADMRINKVVKMIRGPKGSVVTLTVQKPTGEVKLIPITRDIVEIQAAYARGAVLDHSKVGKSVGYIYLPSFYGNTRAQPGSVPERNCTNDVRMLLGRFAKQGIDRVVLDLRGNGGGLLDDARDMSGLFIESGPIVQTRSADGDVEILRDADPSVSFNGKLVVLVDRFSASASEILAAALQDYGRALVVGTGPTHGKGTVQMLLDLDRMGKPAGIDASLGVLKLTRQEFFRVSGGSTQWKGVEPDILLPDPAGYVESGERFLDNSIPWSKVEALEYDAWAKATWDRDALASRSKTRQLAEKVFTLVNKRTALLKAQRDNSLYPLSLDAWKARRERDRKALEEVSPELDKGPVRMAVKAIDYNGKAAGIGNANGKRKSPEQRWKEELARDPWVEEALLILKDMDGVGTAATTK